MHYRVALFAVSIIGCGEHGRGAPGDDARPVDGDNTVIDAPVLDDGATDIDGATGTDSGGGNGPFHGRACLVSDLRVLQAGCDPANAGNINMILARNTASTNADGTFTMGNPPSTKVQYAASRDDLEVTVTPFADPVTFPVVTTTTYDALLASNAVTASGGGVFIQVVNGAGTPIAGATATTAGATSFYDAANAQIWGKTSTGAHGVAWIPGLPTMPDIPFVVTAGGTTKNVAIESFGPGAITFVVVKF